MGNVRIEIRQFVCNMTTHKQSKLIHNYYPFLRKTNIIPLKKGNNTNSKNYLLTNTDKKYVLKILPDKSYPYRINKICQILQYCIENNNYVLEPVANKKKSYFTVELNGYLTKYYPGQTYRAKQGELQDVSRNIAYLHKTLLKCPINFNYKPNNSYYKILKKSELNTIKRIIQNKKFKTKFDIYLTKNIPALQYQFKNFKIMNKTIKKKKLRKQLIHYDLQPSNVIFKNNEVQAIIDFDAMRKGYLIEEVAFSSFRFSSFNNNSTIMIANKLRLFLKKYVLINPLTKEERKCYFFFLRKNILEKISYILKKYYFVTDKSWSSDINKNIEFLKLIDKLESVMKGNFLINLV